MSGVAKAVTKVAKGIGSFVKKYWKVVAIAAACYFTAGAAMAYFGAAGAAGGAAAGVAADAGVSAAGAAAGAGELGAGVAADFTAGAAGDLGAGVAADFGGAAAGTAGADIAGTAAGVGASAIDTGAAQSVGVLADQGASGAAQSTGILASGPAQAGPPGWQQTVQAAQSQGITSATPVSQASSGIWNSITGGKGVYGLLQNQGVMGLVSGFMQGQSQAAMLNENEKWLSAHAPGQVSGKVNYGAGYGDASKWQGQSSSSKNAGQAAAQGAADSSQQSGLAGTSNSANQALTAASSPFGVTTTQPGQAQPVSPLAMMRGQQQQSLLGYMQHVPNFMEGPNGDESTS